MPDDIYDETKRKIMYLEYAPGDDLSVREISQEFDVSTTPVREAFIRLECDGLVRRVPGKGAYVTEVGLKDVKDILEARLFLDEVVATLATKRATDQDIENLEGLLHEFVSESDVRRKQQLHERFHRDLELVTGNRVLIKVLDFMHVHQVRLMLSSAGADLAGTAHYATTKDDFRELIQALRRRDVGRARAALEHHTSTFIHDVQQSILEVTASTRPGENARNPKNLGLSQDG